MDDGVFSNLKQFLKSNTLGRAPKNLLTVQEIEVDNNDCGLFGVPKLEKKISKTKKNKETPSKTTLIPEQKTKKKSKRRKKSTTRDLPEVENTQNAEIICEPNIDATPVQVSSTNRRRSERLSLTGGRQQNVLSSASPVRARRGRRPRAAAESTESTIISQSPVDTCVIDLSAIETPIQRKRGRKANCVRSKRYNTISRAAAICPNVDYVDLITSPVVAINGTINVDSDEEENTTDLIVPENQSLNDSFSVENPEVDIKIKWNGEVEICPLRKYQKFSHLFKKFAEREGASEDRVVFNLDNRFIKPEDTPVTIDYKVYQFITGRIVSEKFNIGEDNNNKNQTKLKRNRNTILLKVQSDQFKRPFQIDLGKNETFKILYIKCAEELNVPCERLKLSFDGDYMAHSATPDDFEFEGGEVIDLRFQN